MPEHQQPGRVPPGGAPFLAKANARMLTHPWLIAAALVAMLAAALTIVPPAAAEAVPSNPVLIGETAESYYAGADNPPTIDVDVSTPAAGSLLLLFVGEGNPGGLGPHDVSDTFEDDGDPTWEELDGDVNTIDGSNYGNTVWYRILGEGASAEATVTVSHEGVPSHRMVHVVAVESGFDPTDPIAQSAADELGDDANATSLDVTFEAPPEVNSLVVASVTARNSPDSGSPVETSDGYTEIWYSNDDDPDGSEPPDSSEAHLLTQYRNGDADSTVTWQNNAASGEARMAATIVEVRADPDADPGNGDTPPPGPVLPDPTEPEGDFIIDEDGGSGTSDSGRIRLTVPEGAVDGETHFTVTDLGAIDEIPDEADDVPPGTILFLDYAGQITAMDGNADPVTEFDEPIEITFILDEEDLEALDEDEDFLVTYWNGDEWIALYTAIDWENGEVTAYTDHLTLFALLEGLVEFSDDVSPTGVTLLSLTTAGAELAAIDQALEREGCDALSIWVTEDGEFFGHVFGAPDFANTDFPHSLSSGAVFFSACAED